MVFWMKHCTCCKGKPKSSVFTELFIFPFWGEGEAEKICGGKSFLEYVVEILIGVDNCAIICNMESYAYVQVIVDIAHSNVDQIFDYALPEDMVVLPGCRVVVPFGKTTVEGIVLEQKQASELPPERIKPVLRVLDEQPVVNEEQIQLAAYICAKYRTTMAFALRLMFPAKLRGERIRAKTVRIAVLTDKLRGQQEIAACYAKNGSVKAKNKLKTLQILMEQEECPTAVLNHASVRQLEQKGILTIVERAQYRTPYRGTVQEPREISYTPAQNNAIQQIGAAVKTGINKTFLLHGVTGSGKTEVYIACVKQALALGKTAIVLVPEISITPQILAEFSRHFGSEIALFHSGLSDGERFDEWRRVQSGEARIVLGARSAVFMPLKNIGLIILDEEQAESYKAENHPPYHAAEIANMRCKIAGSPLVLASATPLIEDYAKAELGIYQLLEMPERIGNLPLPTMHIVDMKEEFQKGNRGPISGFLYRALEQTLAQKKQAMVFLNRRGYASSVVCPSCGNARMCTHCDLPLKYHKESGQLLCHYCGRAFSASNVCPVCGEPFMRYTGMGTEKIQEQLQQLFPKARILRMDFDTTRKKNAHQVIFEAFRRGDADILVGTQMISRGLDFENVTLAAMISADSMLLSGDYRQEEKTFSMIEQVGGRAGRKQKGQVVIQTFNPDHYAIQYAAQHDYKGFYQTEIAFRKVTGKPPFARVYRLVFTHTEQAKAEKLCMETKQKLAQELQPYEQEILLFAAKPAPIAKLDGKSRYHIVLKVRVGRNLNAIKERLYDVWEQIRRKSGVTVGIDIDPYDIN